MNWIYYIGVFNCSSNYSHIFLINLKKPFNYHNIRHNIFLNQPHNYSSKKPNINRYIKILRNSQTFNPTSQPTTTTQTSTTSKGLETEKKNRSISTTPDLHKSEENRPRGPISPHRVSSSEQSSIISDYHPPGWPSSAPSLPIKRIITPHHYNIMYRTIWIGERARSQLLGTVHF